MNHDNKSGPGPDRLLDHNYDGIQEYDNPLPGWWTLIFWVTIVWAGVYFLNIIPGVGSGRGRIANYDAELAAAAERYAAAAATAVTWDDDALRALLADPARLEAGKAVFVQNCAACHKEDGGGNIGPNLTDDHWIHGPRPTQILGIIKNGVLDKGMLAWDQVLTPDEQAAVAAYVLSLHGSNPPDAKEPQGVRASEWTEEAHPEHE
jgi:cytochrome c oxidase cbb3-type subunit 3